MYWLMDKKGSIIRWPERDTFADDDDDDYTIIM